MVDENGQAATDDDASSTESVAEQAAALTRDTTAVWLGMAKRWSERAKTDRVWSTEDVVSDATDLFEQMTPIIERSFDMTIAYLRPWAEQIEALRDDAAPGPAGAAGAAGAADDG